MDMPLFIYLLYEEDHRRNAMRRERKIIRDSQNAFELPDEQFIRMFRLTKQLAADIINDISPHHPNPSRNSAIPLYLKVLATLNFFGHGSFQGSIASSHWNCLSQPMISRSIKTVSRLITDHLMDQWIQFPTTNASKNVIKEGFFLKWGMRGAIGVIDGTHVEILAPPTTDQDHPPFVYINRKGKHTINVMLICDSNCKILAIDARYPGSVHDAAIFRMSHVRQFLQNEYHNGDTNSHLIGDSGYGIEPWLFTPFSHFEPNSPQERFNNLLKRNRNVIERTNGKLKKKFACLSRHRVLLYHPSYAAYIIYASSVCYSMARAANLEFDDDDDIEQEIQDEEYGIPHELEHDGDLGRLARDQYIIHNMI